MRKSVQFLMLFVIACTVSLSASVLERPGTSSQTSETVTSTTDFRSVGLFREFRGDTRTFTPALCCDRPTQDGNIGSETGGVDTNMTITLDRPHFSSRFTTNGLGNAPTPAPEPGSLMLLASGLLSGACFLRRHR